MSQEKVQPKTLATEGPQCNYEDLVCEEKPEYHYDTIHQVCEPEIVANVVAYKATEKGIEEVIKVDEQKALAQRGKSFKKKAKAKEAKAKKKEVAAPTPPSKNELSANQVQVSTHSHGGGEIIAEPVPTQASLSLSNLDVLSLLCHHWLGSEVRSRESRRDAVSTDLKNPMSEFPESERESHLKTSWLGLCLMIPDENFRQTLAERILMKENLTADSDLGSKIWFYPLALPLSAQEFPDLKASAAKNAEPQARLEDPLPVGFVYSPAYYLKIPVPLVPLFTPQTSHSPWSDPVAPFSLLQFGLDFQTLAPAVMVLPPSLVAPKEGKNSLHQTRQLQELKAPLYRVERGSPSQRQDGRGQRERRQRQSST